VGADETGVYALGGISGALPGQTYAGGPDDVFLRKYDHAGNELWTDQFGTSGDDFPAGAVAIDESAIYVGGLTTGALVPGVPNAGDYDLFVRRYDANGNAIWTDQFGGSDFDEIEGIVDYGGKVFVAGTTLSALPGQNSGGSWDGLVRAYDEQGNALWTRTFGGAGSADFHGLAADKTGVYAVGSLSPGPDFTGEIDVLLVKYDFAGNLLWVRPFGTEGEDHAEGVAAWHGHVYVAGFVAGTLPGQVSAGGADMFVRKYDSNGSVVWTRQFGTPANDTARVKRVSTSGRGVFLAGTVASGQALPGQTSAGGLDAFVRQYSHTGEEIWTLQLGTSGNDQVRSVAAGEMDDIYLSGLTSGAFLGFTNAGGNDGFVSRIAKVS
jgi:hypothetical protein